MCYEIGFDLILSIHLPRAKQETGSMKNSAVNELFCIIFT